MDNVAEFFKDFAQTVYNALIRFFELVAGLFTGQLGSVFETLVSSETMWWKKVLLALVALGAFVYARDVILNILDAIISFLAGFPKIIEAFIRGLRKILITTFAVFVAVGTILYVLPDTLIDDVLSLRQAEQSQDEPEYERPPPKVKARPDTKYNPKYDPDYEPRPKTKYVPEYEPGSPSESGGWPWALILSGLAFLALVLLVGRALWQRFGGRISGGSGGSSGGGGVPARRR